MGAIYSSTTDAECKSPAAWLVSRFLTIWSGPTSLQRFASGLPDQVFRYSFWAEQPERQKRPRRGSEEESPAFTSPGFTMATSGKRKTVSSSKRSIDPALGFFWLVLVIPFRSCGFIATPLVSPATSVSG